mmetsp:Transcript_15878/g.20864  ORF Transcript_15878/g.20864 Transcript_15878/m.20864 type:complete len:1146 (+) Transcript_15878:1229-4666(+)
MMAEANDDEFRRSRRSDFIRSLFGDHTTRECSEIFNWWYSSAECKRIKALMAQRDVFIKDWVNEQVAVKDDALKIEFHRRNKAYHIAHIDTVMYELRYVDQCKLEALMINNWSAIRDMLLADSPRFSDDNLRELVLPQLQSVLAKISSDRQCSSAREFVEAVKWLLRAKELPKLKEHVLSDEAAREAGVATAAAMEVDQPAPAQVNEPAEATAQAQSAAPPISATASNINAESNAAILSAQEILAKLADVATKQAQKVQPFIMSKSAIDKVEFITVNGAQVTRFARFFIEDDVVKFAFRLGTIDVAVDEYATIDTALVAQRALHWACNLKPCSGLRCDPQNDKMRQGMILLASKAQRTSGTLTRLGRNLPPGVLGALIQAKSKKRRYGSTLPAVREDKVDSVEKNNEDDSDSDDDLDERVFADNPFYSAHENVAISSYLERDVDGTYLFRHHECAGYSSSVDTNWCASCKKHRGAVHTKAKRAFESHEQGTPDKRRPRVSYLDSPGASDNAMHRQAEQMRQIKAENIRLKAAVQRHVSKYGVEVSSDDEHSRIARLLELTNDEAKNFFPKDSVMRLLWEDQLRNCRAAARAGTKRVCRYSPVTIRTAILLSSKLGNAQYDKIKELFMLPSRERLRHFTAASKEETDGILTGIIKAMRDHANENNFDHGWDRCGALSWDAMTMRSGIYYNYNSGDVLGFSYEDLNQQAASAQLNDLLGKKAASDSASSSTFDDDHHLGKHYLVFYWTGLGKNDFSYPIARFALESVTASLIDELFRKLVLVLEQHTLHVVAAVFDGAAENRSFHKSCVSMPCSKFLKKNVGFDDSFLVAMPHPIWGDEYPIFVLSDMPHSWKKHVNAFEFSNPNNKKKRSIVKLHRGRLQPLCLKMLEDAWVAYESKGSSTFSGEGALVRCRKLSNAHFQRTPFSRMRVKLAVQVLSHSMLDVIDEYCNDAPNQTELYAPMREFISHFDKFVDICNGGNSNNTRYNYGNIESINSAELDDLDEFMTWYEAWYNEIKTDAAYAHFDAEGKKNSFIPEECWFDFQSIAKGIIAMSHFYLTKFPNAKIIQRRLMQDIIEHHFAHIRSSGGGTQNPTIEACQRGTATAGVTRLFFFQNKKSNSGDAPRDHDSNINAPFLSSNISVNQQQH